MPNTYVMGTLLKYEETASGSMDFNFGDITFSDNWHYSLIGRLKIKPIGPLFAAGGYRYDKIDFDENDIKVDADFSGPFAEIGFQF